MKTHAPSTHGLRGSLCSHKCPGPYATRAELVTCKRCLSFPALLRLAFERPAVLKWSKPAGAR